MPPSRPWPANGQDGSRWLPVEARLHRQGYARVAGLDEAGRGCLAGPVVAAAVVLPPQFDLPGIRDSKKLTESQREALFDAIVASAADYAVGSASAREIDDGNILQATRLAMTRALEALAIPPDFVVVDGNFSIPVLLPQRSIVKGDDRCLSIATASILAKVTRDRWMREAALEFPEYGFARHKGYGTRQHLEALRTHGPCPLHRRTFRGVLPASSPPPQGRQGVLAGTTGTLSLESDRKAEHG